MKKEIKPNGLGLPQRGHAGAKEEDKYSQTIYAKA
jgi:hypothetical protein